MRFVDVGCRCVCNVTFDFQIKDRKVYLQWVKNLRNITNKHVNNQNE